MQRILDKLCFHTLFGVYYHPRMRVGNVFGHVCVSVCLCFYLFRLQRLNPLT